MNILNLQDSKPLEVQLAHTKTYVVTKNYYYSNMHNKTVSHILIGSTIYDIISAKASKSDSDIFEVELGYSQNFEIHSEKVV